MRLNIEVELAADEIGLATELLSLLRTLTDHVKVTQQPGASNGFSSPSKPPISGGFGSQPAVSATNSVPASAPGPRMSSAPALPPGASTSQPLAAQPPPAHRPTSQPAVSVPSGVAPTPSPPAASGAAQIPASGSPPPLVPSQPIGPTASQETFALLVARLADEAQLSSVAAEVSALLQRNPDAFNNLAASFMAVVFSPELVAQSASVVPFMMLLPTLPEPWKSKMREYLIPRLLKHMTKPRPVDCDRVELFAEAEAFAAVAFLDFVTITGAIHTIVKLLKNVNTRCAAVTMLGKTVELCYEKLLEKCSAEDLEMVRKALALCTEPEFEYDVQYINESLGWEAASSVLSAGGAWDGHSDTIFTLVHDAARGQLASGSKDGTVRLWDEETGAPAGAPIPLTSYYVCALDIHPAHNLLLVGGVPRGAAGQAGAAAAPCVAAYKLSPGGGAAPHGQLSFAAAGVKLLTSLRALPGTNGFVTGENALASGVDQFNLNFYDMHSSPSFGDLRPAQSFRGHTGMITCVAPCALSPDLFVSGAKDAALLLWDRRNAGPVGRFAKPAGQTLTTVDCASHMILSAGTDRHVTQWDVRSLGQAGEGVAVRSVEVDQSAVLKVAIGASPALTAVSTFHGLYTTDFASEGHPSVQRANGFSDGRTVAHYHDIKWSPARGTLYGGGIDKRIDVYRL